MTPKYTRKIPALYLLMILGLTSNFSCSSSAKPSAQTPSQKEALQKRGISLHAYPTDAPDFFDRGFKKWVLVFQNFEHLNIPTYEIKRLIPSGLPNIDGFVSYPGISSDAPIASSFFADKNFTSVDTRYKGSSQTMLPFANHHPIAIVSERGFLPGEKVTIRVKSPESHIDRYDTIDFYPLPLIVKNNQGKELMTAELISLNPTMYKLHIPFNSANKLWRLQLNSDNEKYNEFLFQEEALEKECLLGIPGKAGGFSELELSYEDGHSYKVTLPWGTTFSNYIQGELPLHQK